MKPLWNAMKTGFSEIRAYKVRSVLSFMAIAVGSVVFMDSFASIVATYTRLQEQKRVSGIARLKISQNRGRVFSNPDEYQQPAPFKYADVSSLRSQLPWLYMVSPEGAAWRTPFEYGGRRVVSRVTGVTPEWTRRDFVYTLKGRFLDWHDLDNKMRVCVLVQKAVPPPPRNSKKAKPKGSDWTAAFDGIVLHNDMLGKIVQLNGIAFTVVGILEELPASKRPAILTPIGQYKVLAPVTTLLHYNLIRETSSLDVTLDAGGEKDFEKAIKLVRNFIKVRFGNEEFFLIENQMEIIQKQMRDSIKISLLNISLGMLAFIAGGIGIMNVTLATVFARIKEIGIRRAVGASRGDIMLQFIVEAAMLGLIGGVLGSALGYLWGVPVKVMLGMEASPIKPWMPAVSVGIAALTSFLFAIYPAWVAAGMKPADALRTE